MVKKIILCGAESTGKSTLAKQLAKYYHTTFIPEYARKYVENLNRDYNYNDIEHIARMQVKQIQEYLPKANNFLFIDTGLIITKVWFQEVFKQYPYWLDEIILQTLPDFYLICANDLAWKNDPVRENGSKERREYLTSKYIQEIKKNKVPYSIIKGKDKERLINAINIIDNIKNNGKS